MRVGEDDAPGVEELARDELRRLAVEAVADDRVADGGEVDADLVRAAGLRARFDQRVPSKRSISLYARDGCAAVFDRRPCAGGCAGRARSGHR